MPNETRPYQICTRCIMDTSDPEIAFDEHGVCNHCLTFDQYIVPLIRRGPEAERRLASIIEKIRRSGKHKRYDCVIGVSGGVDSTYVAYLLRQHGLRPLAVHLDNGWNSELAVSNIEKTLKKLDIDLYTFVMNWEEFRDLQIAFLKASTPDSEIPTDHAIMAELYAVAANEGIRTIISGSNMSTESVLPRQWSHGHSDWRYIKSIHKKFGKIPLRTFPHFGLFRSFYYRYIRRIQVLDILNYVPYVKEKALRILEKEVGWRNYGGKHFESVYTRFFQAYILPRKFGYDKRRAHLSSLILSNQTTREAALQEVANPPYQEDKLEEDRRFVMKKLGLNEDTFSEIMHKAPKTFWHYPSYEMHPVYRAAFLFARLAIRSIRRIRNVQHNNP